MVFGLKLIETEVNFDNQILKVQMTINMDTL